ncbi:MAG: hypothetical protein ACYDH6_14995 [Acidimicrobiales bacterium]
MATRATATRDVGEVIEALRRVGVPVALLRAGGVAVDGVPVACEVRRMAVVTPAIARGLRKPAKDAVGLVIADRISADARRELAARDWGWIDRRGHIRLWSKGLRVVAEIEPLVAARPSARFASAFPPVGVEVALALLKDPVRDWTVKDVALAVGRAASGVSERLRALRDAGLVDRRNHPMRPELFWELVAPWHEQAFGLAELPALSGPFEHVSWLGLPFDWVLTDTQAALFLGAPLLASGAGPPDFYVPQPSIVDSAIAHFGPARGEPAATVRTIRYAGVRDIEPFRRTPAGYPVAHPVVVALDLAHDRGRGREVVESWDPTSIGVERVW